MIRPTIAVALLAMFLSSPALEAQVSALDLASPTSPDVVLSDASLGADLLAEALAGPALGASQTALRARALSLVIQARVHALAALQAAERALDLAAASPTAAAQEADRSAFHAASAAAIADALAALAGAVAAIAAGTNGEAWQDLAAALADAADRAAEAADLVS